VEVWTNDVDVVKTYKVVFKKRFKGKSYELVGAADVRKTQETIEFLDDAGKIVGQFHKATIRDWFILSDPDEPMFSASAPP
jgi:hypothetical protein